MNDKTNDAAAPGTEAPLTEGTVIPDGGQPDVDAILKFDPFAPAKPAEGEKKPGQSADAGKDGKPDAAKAAKPDAAAPKTAMPAAPAKTPEQLIAEHTASIRQMLERAPQPAAPATEAKTEPEAPKFNLGIPDAIMNAMSSEDP